MAVEGGEDLADPSPEVGGQFLVEHTTDVIGAEDVLHLGSPWPVMRRA